MQSTMREPTIFYPGGYHLLPHRAASCLPSLWQTDDGVLSFHTDGQVTRKDGQPKSPRSHLAYGVLDIPPWYLCIFLGIQHFLTALGGLVAVPLILAKDLCLQHDPLTQSYLISTIFFVSGICTLLQVLFGVR
ncbi:solute carrier family 23 member 2-like isoform X1 [Marmota monax]|uniref:solute carrier family 23 member 2-like isoform X1 n=1 Tax=Marmota monax TaxID=9995 RepID=UPI001EB01264|nr:solute carrier family 23 member 2-like isoform X1 [Marmota monax]